MSVEGEGDRIPGHGNWTLRGRNAEEKGKWSSKLASTKGYEGSTKVFRTCKLLQAIH